MTELTKYKFVQYILSKMRKNNNQTTLQYVMKLTLTVVAVICNLVGLLFFIAQMIAFAECTEETDKEKKNHKCYSALFICAIILFCINGMVWITCTRCCFDCFCHGFCHRWRKYRSRKTLEGLQNHPLTVQLDSDKDGDVVKHLESLVKDTWLYDDHFGTDAKSLNKLSHTGIKIRYIFRIDNQQHIAQYLLRHFQTFQSFQLPNQLQSNPIKTKTIAQNGPKTLSQVSLTMMDVLNGTLKGAGNGNEPAMVDKNEPANENADVHNDSLHLDMSEDSEQTERKQKQDFWGEIHRNLSCQFNLPKPKAKRSKSLTPEKLTDVINIRNKFQRNGIIMKQSLSLSQVPEHEETERPNVGLPQPNRGSFLGEPSVKFYFEDEESTCSSMVDITQTRSSATKTVTDSSEIINNHSVPEADDKIENETQTEMAKTQRLSFDTEPLAINPGITNAGEAYLFHGTRLRNVIGILENGFDLGHSKGGLYGKGIYLAESSQKADQYTDSSWDRRTTMLPMFVVRTSLGKVGLYNTKPKLQDGEAKNSDTPVTNDTVVAGRNKRFREFIKQDVTQCYPEFLIIYDRV